MSRRFFAPYLNALARSNRVGLLSAGQCKRSYQLHIRPTDPPLVRLDGMVVNVEVLRREVEEMGGPEKVSLSTLHRSLGLDKITVVKPADEEA